MRKKILNFAAIAFVATLGLGAVVCNTNTARAAEEETAVFEMVAGAQVRTTDPAGIRFVTEANAKYQEALAAQFPVDTFEYVWGTNLQFTDSKEDVYDLNAITDTWKDGTHWYTALVGIPKEDYLTEITATSYVRIYDAEEKLVYEDVVDNAQTRSIAYTASWALNAGDDHDILYTYTNAIPNAEIAIQQENATVVVGTEMQLTASAQPAGYGIAWRSSNENVATVDKNGKVTAVGAGTVEITATLGNATDRYQLTVTPSAESQLIKEFYYRKDASTHVLHEELADTKGVVSEGNFAYGSADLGDGRTNSSAMYMTLSSEYMATLFADATIGEIKFDIILSVDAKRIAICLGTTDKVVLADNMSTSSVELNGVTYYIYTVSITRGNYETYGKNSDMTIRYIHYRVDADTVLGSGSSTFFYVDNLTTEIALFEDKLITNITKANSGVDNALTYGHDVKGKEDVYGTNSISSNSNTMSITISRDYIAELMAIEGVDGITFDIILSEAKQLQLNGNNANFYNGGYYTVSTETVDGITYYTYHVHITKKYYEENKTKAFGFRYVGSSSIAGTSTAVSQFFYVDNLALVK